MDTLSDVHWPAHNDQSGEDYSLSDEDWAAVLARADEGQTLAAEKVRIARAANNALKDAHIAWATALRKQIARLDLGIAKSS